MQRKTNTVCMNEENSPSLVLSNPAEHYTKCKSCQKILFLDMMTEHGPTCLDLFLEDNGDGHPASDAYLEIVGLGITGSFSSLPISNSVRDNEWEKILNLLSPELNQPLELNMRKRNDDLTMEGINSRTAALCKLARCKPFEIRISPIPSVQRSMKLDFKKFHKPIICLKNLKILPTKNKQSKLDLNYLRHLEVRLELTDVRNSFH